MKIFITMICDNDYVIPTMAALQSLRESRAPETELDVAIISVDLSSEAKSRLSASTGSAFHVHFIDADITELSALHLPKKGDLCVATPAALLKFNLPFLLPELDRVLYLDGDILVRSDLTPLWNADLEGATIGAVRDSGSLYFNYKYSKICPCYFNSGVMLLDLAKMRKTDASTRLIQTKRVENASSKKRLMDQNAFNIVFRNDVKLLPIRWNLLLVNLKRAEFRWTLSDIEHAYGVRYPDFQAMLDNAAIWHFSSKDKPWKYGNIFHGDDWRNIYERFPDAIPLPQTLPLSSLEEPRKQRGTKLGRWLLKHGFTTWLGPIVQFLRSMRSMANGEFLDTVSRTRKLENELAPVLTVTGLATVDHERANWEMERSLKLRQKGVLGPADNQEEVIVSLTTYPKRVYDIKYCINSLLSQNERPNRVILWLAREQFPLGEKELPEALLAMEERGLEIRFCEDLKSFKKLIPTRRLFPKAIIVTADDDIIYPPNWLSTLLEAYRSCPKAIWGCRGRLVPFSMPELLEQESITYRDWELALPDGRPHDDIFLTAGAGAVFPPDSLDSRLTDSRLFMKYTPTGDDIWFWIMAKLKGTQCGIVNCWPGNKLIYVNPIREAGRSPDGRLWDVNSSQNAVQILAVLKAFSKELKTKK